jgi:hypothetical protein
MNFVYDSHIKVYKRWKIIVQIVIQTNYNLKIGNNCFETN